MGAPVISLPAAGLVAAAALLVAAALAWAARIAGRRRAARLMLRVRRLAARGRRQLHLRLSETDRAHAERRDYFRQLQELPAATMVTAPDGAILIANAAAVELFGYACDTELQSLNIGALYASAAERGTRSRAALDLVCRTRNTELKMKRKDGSLIDVLTSVHVLQSLGERVYESVWTDITELRRAMTLNRELEAQLHLSQKLEAVGQLASGIAHEINTPIQFISDNVHYLRGSFGKLAALIDQPRNGLPKLMQDADSAFEESLEGIQRVTEIVRAMKEFAHPGDGELSDVDVNHALATTLIVSRNEYKSVATIATDYGDVPLIRGRRGEINKVLLNMIVNASHAIESKVKADGGRGEIRVATRVRHAHVLIEIADTGCGIPESAIKRIFDPFFTTKPVGKGTGQGLAIALAIVTSHGGHIDVTSKPGQGTTFHIFLPMPAEETAQSALPDAPEQVSPELSMIVTGAGS